MRTFNTLPFVEAICAVYGEHHVDAALHEAEYIHEANQYLMDEDVAKLILETTYIKDPVLWDVLRKCGIDVDSIINFDLKSASPVHYMRSYDVICHHNFIFSNVNVVFERMTFVEQPNDFVDQFLDLDIIMSDGTIFRTRDDVYYDDYCYSDSANRIINAAKLVVWDKGVDGMMRSIRAELQNKFARYRENPLQKQYESVKYWDPSDDSLPF